MSTDMQQQTDEMELSAAYAGILSFQKLTEMLEACLYIDLKVMSDMKVFDNNRYKDRQVIVSLRVKIFLKMEDLVKKKAWNLNNFKAARESMKAMKRN